MTTKLLGDLIYSLSLLKAEKKQLDTDLELVESRITTLENEIMNTMEADGIEESASTVGKVSKKTSTYPQIAAWDQLEEHVFGLGRPLVLLEKRVAVGTYREMLSLRRAVPGVVPFLKRKLTFRPLNNDD
jgi:hypothetical protein